jgi:hypothetical protein
MTIADDYINSVLDYMPRTTAKRSQITVGPLESTCSTCAWCANQARVSAWGRRSCRQLPMFLQVFWIDALFALFTDRSQRAFELLSKTRVVRT